MMNDPHRPLNAETLDELLSADIDGELDRAANELGLTPEDARTAVDAAPEALGRRRALEAARDLFSTQPTLDPEVTSRLVASALSAVAPAPVPIRSHRRRTAWRAFAGAAAAAAVVAGIVVVAAKNPGSASKSSASSATAAANAGAAPAHPPARGTVAFGDVSLPQALRARVRYFGPLKSTALPEATAKTAAPADATTRNRVQPPAASSGVGTFDSGASATDPQLTLKRAPLATCIAKIARARNLRGAPLLSGTGTAHARPVYVVVFREGPDSVAYVLSTADCSVIARDKLP